LQRSLHGLLKLGVALHDRFSLAWWIARSRTSK
jgi:hypothetical protein